MFDFLKYTCNCFFDKQKQELINNLYNLTCGELRKSSYYRQYATPGVLKAIASFPDDSIILEKYLKKIVQKAEVIKEKTRSRYLGKLVDAENVELPESVYISVEWVRSKTWGMNPHVTVTTGNKEFLASASGCGYDKESQAISAAFNQSPQMLRILYEYAETGKKLPEAIYEYAGIPYYAGGCGVSCYYNIFSACGYKFKKVATGKTYDAYEIRKVTKKEES